MAENIESQYDVLSSLRKIDEKRLRIELDLTRIPEEKSKLESQLAQYKSIFEIAKEKADATAKRLRETEMELKAKEDAILKAEAKMMEVTSNEAYRAAQKENDVQIQEKSKLEDEILNLMTSTDEEKESVKKAEATYKEEEAKINAEIAKLNAEEAELKGMHEEQLKVHESTLSELDLSLKNRYLTVSRGVVGAPIAAVENGVCRGCQTRVMPQAHNEILGHLAIHQCQNCGRLLVLAPKEEEAALNSDAHTTH